MITVVRCTLSVFYYYRYRLLTKYTCLSYKNSIYSDTWLRSTTAIIVFHFLAVLMNRNMQMRYCILVSVVICYVFWYVFHMKCSHIDVIWLISIQTLAKKKLQFIPDARFLSSILENSNDIWMRVELSHRKEKIFA